MKTLSRYWPPKNPRHTELTGARLDGRYEIEELIGQGGVGIVARARQLTVDRPVAVKLLRPEYQGDHTTIERFMIEAQALARLNHPNCVTLFDFGYDDDHACFYMVMEHIEGPTFSEFMWQGGRTVGDQLEILAQVSEALHEAHQKGITHRDLKPGNIMLASSSQPWRAKILDFGLARLLEPLTGEQEGEEPESHEADRLTITGHIYGTPAYMSPEQCSGSKDIGPSSDIYSLGIMIYEVLHGTLPYEHDSFTRVLLGHMQEPLPAIAAHVPEALRQALELMTSKEPEPRQGVDLIELARILRQSAASDFGIMPREIPLLRECMRGTSTHSQLPHAVESSPTLDGATLPFTAKAGASQDDAETLSAPPLAMAQTVSGLDEENQRTDRSVHQRVTHQGRLAMAANNNTELDPTEEIHFASRLPRQEDTRSFTLSPRRSRIWVLAASIIASIGMISLMAASADPTPESAPLPVTEVSAVESAFTAPAERLVLSQRILEGAGLTIGGAAVTIHPEPAAPVLEPAPKAAQSTHRAHSSDSHPTPPASVRTTRATRPVTHAVPRRAATLSL